jgi:hypothetical protein
MPIQLRWDAILNFSCPALQRWDNKQLEYRGWYSKQPSSRNNEEHRMNEVGYRPCRGSHLGINENKEIG